MDEKKYRVIKPYWSTYYSQPILLPVGTILTYWRERGFYLSSPVYSHCVPVRRWVVEAWHDYFEPVDDTDGAQPVAGA